MPSLAVTVIGRDRPGIIAEVTGVLADLGGNLEDSSMTLLRGHFTWTLIVDIESSPEALSARLAHLGADGLVVSVLPVGPEEPPTGEAGYVLSVHGADRPGIVAGVTATLAEHGGNITDLSTRLGHGGMYLLVAEVSLPPDVDVVALGAQLADAGRNLGVGVSLRPADSDVLQSAVEDMHPLRPPMPELPVGTILPVVTAPHPALGTRCVEVDPRDPEVMQLAADLIATMRVSPGCVGLAANQVGVGWRLFSLDVSRHPKARTTHGTFVLVNPVVVAASRNEKGREGCMSVPDFTGDVRRATRMTVAGVLPGTGEQVTLTTDAFEARALQHEIDHLDGLLFLDRVAGAHAIHPRTTYL